MKTKESDLSRATTQRSDLSSDAVGVGEKDLAEMEALKVAFDKVQKDFAEVFGK